jgi:hypothetical protein
MPWIPELFSAPALARLEEKWQRERLDAVPYYGADATPYARGFALRTDGNHGAAEGGR